MRRLLISLLALPLLVVGQSPLTQISDIITLPNGSHPSGTATISWQRAQNDANPRETIFPGSVTITITNGVVTTSLFPNTVMLPVGLCYAVAYHLGLTNSTRYWYVPVSDTPVTLNTIEGSNACPTQGGGIIPLGEIANSGASPGQVPIWNGTFWAPGSINTTSPGMYAQSVTQAANTPLVITALVHQQGIHPFAVGFRSSDGMAVGLAYNCQNASGGPVGCADPTSNGTIVFNFNPAFTGTIEIGGLAASNGSSAGGNPGQFQINNNGRFGGVTVGGDGTINPSGVLTVTKSNGNPLVTSAIVDTTNAANISTGILPNARLSVVPNSSLANSTLTINALSPLAGGGLVSLGGSLNISCPTCGSGSGGNVTLTGDVTGSGPSPIATTVANITGGATVGGYLAFGLIPAPGLSTLGTARVYIDSTSLNLASINTMGVVNHGVQTLGAVSHKFVVSLNDAGALSAAQPACADLSNAAASCSTDATNATNISSGTIAAARLPAINLAASGAGGVVGNLPVTNLGGGVGASGSTVWAGDGTWKAIAGGGTVTNTAGLLTASHLMVGNNGVDSRVLPSLGTSTTVLHGNNTGDPTYTAVVLTTDVSGVLPFANGGTGLSSNFTNHQFFGNNTGSTAAPVATQPTFADLAAGTVLARGTFPGGDLFEGGVNAQTGASYAILTSDENKLVTFNNGGATAVTLSQATTSGFTAGAKFYFFNIGAGTVTITPATSNVNGNSTLVLAQNQGAFVESDGTNYSAWVSANPSGAGTVTSVAAVGPITATTNPIVATGSIGCATCVTSAAAETLNQLIIGQGSQGTAALGSLGTVTTVLHGNLAGIPSFGSVVNNDIAAATIDLTAKVTNVLPVANGGTATSTAFTTGSVVFAGAAGTYTQNNANLFWDNSNNRLGIKTATPAAALDVNGGMRSTAFIAPATGSGLELYLSSGIGQVLAYNRTGTAYLPLQLDGLNTFINGVSGGVVAVAATSTSGGSALLQVTGGGVQILPHTQGTCNFSNRGTFWYSSPGGGVKDSLNFCAADGAGTYNWRSLY